MLLLLTAFGAAALAAPEQGPVDADPIVCKRDKTAEVGTHLRPKKVCLKKSEWDLVEKNTQNELQHLSDRAAFNPGFQPTGPKPH